MKVAYIDAQNIHKWIQELGRILDWKKIYDYMKEKYEIDKFCIFFGYVQKYQKLYNFLKSVWYDVIFKEVSTNKDWTIKWNVDIDIAIKSMNDIISWELEQAYLITTDVDFNSLIYEFRNRGIWWRLIVTDIKYTSKYLRKASESKIQSLSDIKHIVKFEDNQKGTDE